MSKGTIGERLLALKERSGLSLSNIAKAAGYRNASSIQRYFAAEYEVEYLPRNLADRLHNALVGFGDPPIVPSDVESLTEYGFMLDRRDLTPRIEIRPRAIPQIDCVGSYGSRALIGEAEIFTTGETPLRAFSKPKHLIYRPVDALFVSTSSMEPKYQPGDIVFFERERPAGPGDDCILVLDENDGRTGGSVLARLVARTRAGAELEILNPPSRFVVPHEEIDDIIPLLSADELLEQIPPDPYA